MTPSPVEGLPQDVEFVKGLPQGVKFVKIGTPDENDFYIVNEPDGKGGHVTTIVQGPRAATFESPTPHLTPATPTITVIVKASDGWKFKADIRTLGWVPVKVIAPPKQITATAQFTVSDEADLAKVNDGLDKLKTLPGFTGLS